MANYSTLLETWGDTGQQYPSGYSVVEGEQPVDAWENFTKYNTIEDIKHLISLTNKRIETDKGASGSEPASPESSHLFHDTSAEALSFWDSTAGSWHRLLAADGDTLEGALNFNGKAAQNVGPLNMAATADLDGNDLVDGTTTIWDTSAGQIPLAALAANSVTVTAGSGLSGGGSASLGGSVTLNVSDGSGSGLDADTVDGFHADDLGVNIEENGTLSVSSSTGIDFTGHLNVIDDGDGTVTIDPSHNHDSRYDNYNYWTIEEGDGEQTNIHSGQKLEIYGGSQINTEITSTGGETRLQVNHDNTSSQGDLNTSGGTIIDTIYLDGNGHVTNMGTRNLDGRYYNEGQKVNDADKLDGNHASAFASSGHNHDGRYARLFDGVQAPVFASTSDVPTGITKGEVVFIDGDGLYVEDGV
ncbi:hypothetical protein HRTV-25_gp34 [Halorubrum tailed virus 25]|uniref:Uncharacterized protein n=1 Tax=Halorubrum tailed virus 25 TaxID=2878006 RepID=A0AAE9BXK4_9CAUD|nr:hypothetical protein M1M37_gp034 [Halorubrum tailed virus 25]UBF22615.1 hypothetical protein HRTV-25_gp34 [Halorubrum tailed virus 25]